MGKLLTRLRLAAWYALWIAALVVLLCLPLALLGYAATGVAVVGLSILFLLGCLQYPLYRLVKRRIENEKRG